MIEIGRVCVKLAGHEAGKKVLIVEIIDPVFVTVSGPGAKRRRCNVAHLEPLEQKLEISKGASDEEVSSAMVAAGLAEAWKPREAPPAQKA